MVILFNGILFIAAFMCIWYLIEGVRSENLKKQKIQEKVKTFVLGLPDECYLFVSGTKTYTLDYERGYYLYNKEGNIEFDTTSIKFYGQHMNPEHPMVKKERSSNGQEYFNLEYITIPTEWVVNDLVTVKYLTNGEEYTGGTNQTKKQKERRKNFEQ